HSFPTRRSSDLPPHQAHHLALAHLEGDTAEDVARLDEHVDVVKREHARGSPSASSPPSPSSPPHPTLSPSGGEGSALLLLPLGGEGSALLPLPSGER